MKKKVIFSTMGLYPKRNIAIALAVFLAGEIFLFLSCSPKSILFWLLTPVMLLPLRRAYFMKKSYIILHEEYVTGFSIPQNCLSAPCEFRLTYDEISYAQIHGNTVRIFYEGGSYTVQARDVSPWVTRVIKDQKAAHLVSPEIIYI